MFKTSEFFPGISLPNVFFCLVPFVKGFKKSKWVNSAKGIKWVKELKEIWKLKRIKGLKRQMNVKEATGLGLIIAVDDLLDRNNFKCL